MELPSDVWMPLFIFCARIVDVSLGTMRIIFVSKGMRLRAAALGFLEVLIWIIVVAQLIGQLTNWMNFVAYAAGFSAGTYLGMWIENKLKVGTLIVRIITAKDVEVLTGKLADAGFDFTHMEAEGSLGPVEILFTIVKRKNWSKLKNIIESFDADAFYSVEDVKFASETGNGELPKSSSERIYDRLLKVRKGV